MHPARRRARTRVRLVGLAAVAALAATLTLSTGPVAAHDDDHESSKSSDTRNCTKAERKLLKQAGDNFAEACRPGKNLAAMNDSGADLAAGDWAAVGMKLLKNIPKQGAFASQTAFNSDLAFKGEYAYAGNYEGFMIYDLGNPRSPEPISQVVCPGSQNDVSVYRNLLVLSTDSSRSDNSCASVPQPATEESSWEGLKVFDISDPTNPRYIAAVETPCGSHTHTLAPSKNGSTLWVYVSSYFPDDDVPRLPAAARPDQRREDLHGEPCGCRARRHPCALPRRRQPARATTRVRPAAATTSPPTRRRTSLQEPAWATASCWTSPTGSTRW